MLGQTATNFPTADHTPTFMWYIISSLLSLLLYWASATFLYIRLGKDWICFLFFLSMSHFFLYSYPQPLLSFLPSPTCVELPGHSRKKRPWPFPHQTGEREIELDWTGLYSVGQIGEVGVRLFPAPWWSGSLFVCYRARPHLSPPPRQIWGNTGYSWGALLMVTLINTDFCLNYAPQTKITSPVNEAAVKTLFWSRSPGRIPCRIEGGGRRPWYSQAFLEQRKLGQSLLHKFLYTCFLLKCLYVYVWIFVCQ